MKNVKMMTFPLSFLPIPAAAGYHYYQLSQFLEYCEIKYQKRGLYDDDLCEYHKKNSARPNA